MPIKSCACVVIECDRCDEGWEDGIPHFDTLAEAAEHARTCGWLVTDSLTLCEGCAAKATCERVGHVWPAWSAFKEPQGGIRYRTRYCEQCTDVEYDPPFFALVALREAAEVVDAAAGEAS